MRLWGEMSKDGGRRRRPWLPPSPVQREERREVKGKDKGFESEGEVDVGCLVL